MQVILTFSKLKSPSGLGGKAMGNNSKELKNYLEIKVPTQKVIETKDRLLIDNFDLGFVAEDSVRLKYLSKDIVEVSLTFYAQSYEFKETDEL